MATMKVIGNELHVRFSGWERPAVWRASLVVPLAAVRRIEGIDKPLGHVRGGRMGFLISGVVKVGVWGLGTGSLQLVSVRRNVGALRITLDRKVSGGRFEELLISTKSADKVAEEIGARADS
ncbi:hypothetical protein DDE19_12460 [Micromonospora ureilytica]|uniref:Uncharacterized protein n=1 Tax=Micromonospora ureilytica TaxID=709868 RepID=A0A3N9XWW7_9ACTN|nr:hypothetical protein [Micromonospora ureilytica]RQX17152.1 hypothetical protein DDE19_12460 [Micromonospora ureilytica]